MSKVLYGVYEYDVIDLKLNKIPTEFGFVEQDFIDEIIKNGKVFVNSEDKLSVRECKIFKIYRQIAENVPSIIVCVKNVADRGYDSSSQSDTNDETKQANMAGLLLDYIDSLVEAIIVNEEIWSREIATYSRSRLDNIINSDKELATICACIDKNKKGRKDNYLNLVKKSLDPFIPYKKFIETFLTDCNFYDIIPLQRKRLKIFKQQAKIIR